MAHGLVAEDRQTSVLFRMSHDQKTQLRRDADALGITVQALLERRVLGNHDAVSRVPGRKPRPQQEELPLTG